MANYYEGFSFEVPIEAGEQREFFKAEVTKEIINSGYCDDAEDIHWDGVDEEESAPDLWINSECQSLDAIIVGIAAWQKKFDVKEPTTIQRSWGCSKPRLDAFGGAVTVVYKGDIASQCTGNMADELLEGLKVE